MDPRARAEERIAVRADPLRQPVKPCQLLIGDCGVDAARSDIEQQVTALGDDIGEQ